MPWCRPPAHPLLRSVRCMAAAREGESAEDEVEVPEVGWMWQTGSNKSPLGKAPATRASLRQANIKAKKWVLGRWGEGQEGGRHAV